MLHAPCAVEIIAEVLEMLPRSLKESPKDGEGCIRHLIPGVP